MLAKKAAAALAAIVIPLSVCTLAAPTASAAPQPETTPALGPVVICLNIPLGSVSLSFCI
ncbi:hypothetical protein ACFYT3_33480 [Nocardia amikacinitolerans]|uniref:Uncharacterized protein n=1 Tax=Nocardia amikacinitolerans TaxID=756689 RepID=A0A285L4I1_9NOCA|nr:hypothetical protein [Nocardia amikacinitolerans]MCP2279413.1 hypothetical protein [Nocardia amikacinitolerans]MCP2292572.1 hypothetical protein [Nocardia amikacinitolerans]MCP2296790.1 hypothetical protein [Nocardia amikacinitolerans]SNY78546.1 hypothetical protein SAMN04244553_1322 [Nocardia amikacinitolerans]